MKVGLLYSRPPPPGKLNGVLVTPESPGLPPWAFREQHGATPFQGREEQITGLDACTEHVEVQVADARQLERPAALDGPHGFSLATDGSAPLPATEALASLREDSYVTSVLYKQMEELVLNAMPGATAAFAFNHVRRLTRRPCDVDLAAAGGEAPTKRARQETKPYTGKPSYMCHSDSTLDSWPARLKELLAEGSFGRVKPTFVSLEQGARLAGAERFLVVNAWRLIASFGADYVTHLALCDASTVDLEKDTLPFSFVVDGCQATNYGLRKEKAGEHRWYYYPRLHSNEVLLFKAFDSCDPMTRKPNWVFHGAVDDPAATEASPPRESIEVRVAVLFESSASHATGT